MSEWISVYDSKPDDTRDVLVFDDGEIKTGFYHAGWVVLDDESDEVTHWMELPEPPSA